MARGGDFQVAVEASPDGRTTIVRVDGDVDLATCSELEQALEEGDLGGRTVVDLSDCTFLDSSALRVLVQRARAGAAEGGVVALVTDEPGILRILEIASVVQLLPVHATLEAALS